MFVGTLGPGVLRAAGDSRPLAELYREALARAHTIEELGYDFMLLGEHHFMASQSNPSPLMLLSAIATQTSTLRLGTNVLMTPFYNPLRLAEDVAVLDQLSNGRVELICGSGSMTSEFETYGVDPATRFGRVWETLGFLRRAFTEERFDHRGRYYTFPNVRLTTKPVQQPFPLWFGGYGPKMLQRAGREGYPIFAGNHEAWALYEAALRQSGLDPNDFNRGAGGTHNQGVGGGTIVVVENQQDRDAIYDRVLASVKAQVDIYSRADRDLAFANVTPHWIPPVVGTPDEVLAYLEPDLKVSCVTHFQTSGDPKRLALFATEVLPTLHTWGRAPVAPQAAAIPA